MLTIQEDMELITYRGIHPILVLLSSVAPELHTLHMCSRETSKVAFGGCLQGFPDTNDVNLLWFQAEKFSTPNKWNAVDHSCAYGDTAIYGMCIAKLTTFCQHSLPTP